MSGNRSNNTGNNNDNSTADYWTAGVVAGLGALAVGVGAYYLASSSEAEKKKKEKEQRKQEKQRERERQEEEERQKQEGGYSMWNLFTDVMQTAGNMYQSQLQNQTVVVPDDPKITNLNGLLHDIYVRFIALKDNEFEEHYRVFMAIFYRLHERMKEADKYYNRYSSTVQFAGSHFDGLRINKPDEFDMDIIIRLPVNLNVDPINPGNSDIVLEPKLPGYIQLKAGTQFQNMPKRDGREWLINRTAYEWMDERNYLLRSRFISWFQSVVNKALNSFDLENGRRVMRVEGLTYTLGLTASGPAITLVITNTWAGFRLDVDLVPALKFPEERWPICRGYRSVPNRCKKDIFMVVPKPMKGGLTPHDTVRSWRLAMHLQEKDLMHGTENMRQAIRLIKKLRDSQGMDKIASYYIKTAFYHEAMDREHEPSFWRNSPATLFTIMVKKFHQCLEKGEIPYFWNKENNLIGHIEKSTLTGYANKLKKLIAILDDRSQYKLAAKYLLTEREFKDYNDKFLHI